MVFITFEWFLHSGGPYYRFPLTTIQFCVYVRPSLIGPYRGVRLLEEQTGLFGHDLITEDHSAQTDLLLSSCLIWDIR